MIDDYNGNYIAYRLGTPGDSRIPSETLGRSTYSDDSQSQPIKVTNEPLTVSSLVLVPGHSTSDSVLSQKQTDGVSMNKFDTSKIAVLTPYQPRHILGTICSFDRVDIKKIDDGFQIGERKNITVIIEWTPKDDQLDQRR